MVTYIFLLHNNSLHIILLNLRKRNKKNYPQEKKIEVKKCTKPLLCDANYERENNDSTNALRPRCS